MCENHQSETKMSKTEIHTVSNDWHQYYATFIVNLIMLSQGAIIGWVAPALPRLTSENTPLQSGQLTNEQSSWIGSLNSIGSLMGSIVIGYLISCVGCKRSTIILVIPSITFWLLIYFGNSYYYLLLANFCGGLVSGASAATIILYISEIANDNIRGRLGSVQLCMRNIGILLAYILGATVDYKFIPCICITIPIIFTIVFSILPNTPQYYLQRDKTHKAEYALKYYKGHKGSVEQANTAFYDEFERLKSIAFKRKTEEKLGAADICNPNSLKGLGTGLALVLFSQFTANLPFINYAVVIFKLAGTSLNPYLSSIMFAIALILGSFVTTYLADILGRKFLNFTSLMGAAIGMFAFATYQYFRINGHDLTDYAWIPVACLSFTIFISSAGITPLSVVCALEYMPPKIRTVGMAAVSFLLSILGFVSVKTFPTLINLIGLHGCLIFYGSGCAVGAVFVLYVQKETSGQSIDNAETDTQSEDKLDKSQKTNQPLISTQS